MKKIVRDLDVYNKTQKLLVQNKSILEVPLRKGEVDAF